MGRLDQYESYLPLVTGNSTWTQTSYNCPEKLLCSSGDLDMWLSWALSLKIALTITSDDPELWQNTDLEWCQTLSTALSFEDWEYDKGLYRQRFVQIGVSLTQAIPDFDWNEEARQDWNVT